MARIGIIHRNMKMLARRAISHAFLAGEKLRDADFYYFHRAIYVVCSLLITTVCFAGQTPAIKTKPAPNTVALTFNDGPDPRYTAKILDILQRHGVRATFFVLGDKAKKHPELVALIARQGHVVASHTMTHPKMSILSDKRVIGEVEQSRNAIKQAVGKAPKCIRPPYGAMTPRVREVVEQHDMRVVTWDLDSFDYRRHGAEWMTNWVLNNARPKSVIMMHDSGRGAKQTVAALPKIIEGFAQRGLKFDVICE